MGIDEEDEIYCRIWTKESGPLYLTRDQWLEIEDSELHREDGPAEEYVDGDMFWFQNGELHRIDGPAVIYNSGLNKEWWIYGQWFNKEKIEEWLKDNDIDLSTEEGQMALILRWV